MLLLWVTQIFSTFFLILFSFHWKTGKVTNHFCFSFQRHIKLHSPMSTTAADISKLVPWNTSYMPLLHRQMLNYPKYFNQFSRYSFDNRLEFLWPNYEYTREMQDFLANCLVKKNNFYLTFRTTSKTNKIKTWWTKI